MFVTQFNSAILALAGLAVAATVSGENETVAYTGDIDACTLTVTDAGDGILVEAWSAPDMRGEYRMRVTQMTGGGSFDILQEGEILPADIEPEGDQLLSEIWMDVEASFNARLTTWNTGGERVCETIYRS